MDEEREPELLAAMDHDAADAHKHADRLEAVAWLAAALSALGAVAGFASETPEIGVFLIVAAAFSWGTLKSVALMVRLLAHILTAATT